MNTESQAVALGIDGINHLVDVLGFKRSHVQNRAENFLFQLFNSAHLKHCRRHEQALLRYVQFLEQLALLLEFLAMVGNLLAGIFVDHRAHIGRQLPRITNAQFLHGTVEHFQQIIGNVLLYIQHAKCRTALTGALEGGCQHITHHLLRQRGGIHDHGVQATGFCHQRCIRLHVFGHGLVDPLRRGG